MGLGRATWVAALAAAVVGCGAAAKSAARGRVALVPEPERPLAQRLIDADRVVAGQLLEVEEALEYEPLGSIRLGLGGAKAVVPLAYNAKIRVDSTLWGGSGATVWFTFFAPQGAGIPQPGRHAVWVLHRRALWRLKQCSEQQSLTSAACPYDVGLALDSDDDIRPPEEWARLRTLARTLGLSPPLAQP